MSRNLVIVESPAKAKTIEKFLGSEFTVRSSYGHVRDLVKKGLGIDVDRGFEPEYAVSDDKKKVVAELAREAKGAEVWLASDEDREGEAIAWHLTQVLGLPVESTKRIVFHEITKNAILNAVQNPRTVDMRLVDAQQARRILDRLVGFELSPLLWRKIKPGLSAGRVQSVTVRLLVEREREIIAFEAKDYFRVTARFVADGVEFGAELSRRFDDADAARRFLEGCVGAQWRVESVEKKPGTKSPAPPFTTSTLQQEAGRKLGMSVKMTMSTAQRLYENGFITYMRTDSVNLSGQALAAAKQEIITTYGEKYHQIRNYKTKTKGAQEAHEAIRPSYMDRETIDGSPAEKKLYELIRKRTLASQMASAQVERTTVKIISGGVAEHFTATGEVTIFDGFMRLYSESVEDVQEENGEGRLPALKQGEALEARSVAATQRFTQSPPRYSEASLVKRLEELGIGRPSTYAPTISTIMARGYVIKQNREGVRRDFLRMTLEEGNIVEKTASENVGSEKNKLSPTDIGMVVNDYLEGDFPHIMEYNFTATVEKEFDEIADGDIEWRKMIGDFYGPFHDAVGDAMTQERTYDNAEKVLGTDPKTGRTVSARIGRFGPLVQIAGDEEKDEKPRYASMREGQLIATITLEEALALFALPRTVGEWEGKEVVIGVGRFGPYIRHDGKFTSLGKGMDPLTITLEQAIELIQEKRTANEPLKVFGDNEILILKGRYGPYIASGGKNYRIPKGADPLELTLEEVQAVIAKEGVTTGDTGKRPKRTVRAIKK